MGRIVLAAKITHVPTMLMSEQPGRVYGARRQAIDGHVEIARRARHLGADTIIICDTHWMVNAGYHLNANERFTGTFTSSEFPHFIRNMAYDYPGNPALGDLIAATARAKGVFTLSHRIDSLELEYGTLVPMYFMSRAGSFKVISVAAWCATHAYETSRKLGQAIREAVEASDSKVLLLASGSLSHSLWANDDYEANNGTFTISSEFNRQMDLRVLELWEKGEIATFLKMLADYARHCSGEGLMHDTAMMFGALGWEQYTGKGEMIGEYFPSSGTGQANVVFTL